MRQVVFSFLVLLTGVFSTPAVANNSCDDLWFTRNLVFAQAGYCFSSRLGKSVFGNGNCVGKNPYFGETEKRLVAQIKQLEKWEGCRVNTSGSRLDISGIRLRMYMRDLPVATGAETECRGWIGGNVALLDSHGNGGRRLGVLQNGDDFVWEHEDVNGWSFVTVNGGQTMGWARLGTEPPCRFLAG
jgi:hypothetical protein